MTPPHDRAACEFCRAVASMKQIIAQVDAIPEFDVRIYDDAVQRVAEVAETAADVLACYLAYCEDHAHEAQ